MQNALSDWSKSIEIAPNNSAAYYNRALVYDYFNRFKETADDYEKAWELNYPITDKERASIMYRLARMYSSLGNEEYSKQLISEAINLLVEKDVAAQFFSKDSKSK